MRARAHAHVGMYGECVKQAKQVVLAPLTADEQVRNRFNVAMCDACQPRLRVYRPSHCPPASLSSSWISRSKTSSHPQFSGLTRAYACSHLRACPHTFLCHRRFQCAGAYEISDLEAEDHAAFVDSLALRHIRARKLMSALTPQAVLVRNIATFAVWPLVQGSHVCNMVTCAIWPHMQSGYPWPSSWMATHCSD